LSFAKNNRRAALQARSYLLRYLLREVTAIACSASKAAPANVVSG
jgi:hypothetical protein